MHTPLIQVLPLFNVLDEKLGSLLSSLTPEEWQRPTIARLWTVKDIAAHLLDGNLRTLSMLRDNYTGEPPADIHGHQDLVNYLNRLNADWVAAMKRVSPAVLIEWLAVSGKQYNNYLQQLPPFEQAPWPVGWAGEAVSANWFHIARDYTEKWHHQQQIRDAVHKPGIMTPELYYPCLDTFMQALPYTYRHVEAPAGTLLQFTITGEGGGDWYLVKEEKWQLLKSAPGKPAAHTTIAGAVAWKLFTKSWRREDVQPFITISGDQLLGEAVLDMIAVMA